MREKGTGSVYRIVVRSEISGRYAAAFEGMEMETNNGETIFTGEVVDQAHLYGILNRLNGMAVQLVSVVLLSEGVHRSAGSDRVPRP
jgi:hypothetical protein